MEAKGTPLDMANLGLPLCLQCVSPVVCVSALPA